MGEGWGGDGEGDGVGWTVCGRAKRGERGETARPSFNPVDLGRAWQATSDKPTLGDLTNGSTTSFFGRVQCVHRPAQPASLAWQPRQAHCEKKSDLFLGHTSSVCMPMARERCRGEGRGAVVCAGRESFARLVRKKRRMVRPQFRMVGRYSDVWFLVLSERSSPGQFQVRSVTWW